MKNPIAKDLRTPKYSKCIVESKKVYLRKKAVKILQISLAFRRV